MIITCTASPGVQIELSFEYELEIGGRDMGKMAKKYSQIQKT
jgi:hypothetical protein